MLRFRMLARWLAVILAAGLSGCLPPGAGPEEEKEMHFQTGRARVNAMDYGGAVESFQKALEVNPHSGAAHFELGWLYADKVPDPAAAIYHYERYLALRPRAENAETIRQHIYRLKQELAKAVLPLPSTPAVQRQLEQLMEENRRLQEELKRWRDHYASHGLTMPGQATNTSAALARPAPTPEPRAASPTPSPAAASVRTHKVQAGETPAAIARKYNVKLEALLASNPRLDPKRMQVGQVLNVPAP
jgi:tetratricopeptide (TPR) repeat protein